MKRKLFTLATMLTLVAFAFGAYAAPQYIEALTVGTLGATTFTGLVIGTDVQAWDTDLDALAGVNGAANSIPYFTATHTCDVITSSANMVSLLGSATFAAAATALSLEIGVDTQAYDSDLDTWATLTPTANAQTLVESTNFLSMTQDLSVEVGVDTQAYNANLTSFATVAPAANMLTFLASATFASMAQDMSVEIGVDTQAYDADLDTYATITPSATAQVALASGNNSVVLSTRARVTTAEINAGHEILAAVTGLSYRIVNIHAVAYGGAVGTTTTVDVLGTQSAGGVKIAAFKQASLTQSQALAMHTAAACDIQADGASFIEMDAASAITIGKTGGDVDTATGVDFIIQYVLE